MRVLIVEDEARLARSWRRLLEMEGHEALTAGTFADALAVIQEAASLGQALDVVLLDQHLPDGRGSDLLETLALRHPDAAVAVVSGELDSDQVLALVPYGALPVPKPVSTATLLGLVRVLRRSPDGVAGKCAAFAAAHGLSPREGEVLTSGVLGLTAAETAEAIDCVEKTLSTHWHRIFEKTGYHSQRDVVAAVLRESAGCGRAGRGGHRQPLRSPRRGPAALTTEPPVGAARSANEPGTTTEDRGAAGGDDTQSSRRWRAKLRVDRLSAEGEDRAGHADGPEPAEPLGCGC